MVKKMLKRLIAILLAASMALLLCACSGEYEKYTPDGREKIRIGLITDVGGINDRSFNELAWKGLSELSVEDGLFDVVYLESRTDADYETNLYTLIDEGMDLIISVGYMAADSLREVALDNPDQKFAIVDDITCADLPNVACITFSQEEAAYLAGIVAGSVTKTGTVGYVQGMVSSSMNLFGVGYIAGVKKACPEAKILQYNANSFADIAGGTTAAKNMITGGADVIFHAAGSTGIGVINACEESGIWAIGVDQDQSNLSPDHVITSAVKCVDHAIRDVALSVKDGTYRSGVCVYNLKNKGVDLAPTRDHIPAEVLRMVEEAREDVITGRVHVPDSAALCPEFVLGN